MPHTGGGYSEQTATIHHDAELCPTQVGVTLDTQRCLTQILPLPHTGGGYSNEQTGDYKGESTLPHTGGGYSVHFLEREIIKALCPTQVGVTLLVRLGRLISVTLPHTGGGYSP